MGAGAQLIGEDDLTLTRMNGYAGSVAFDGAGKWIAISSPRGNVVHVYDANTHQRVAALSAADVCGLARSPDGMVCTTGTGDFHRLSDTVVPLTQRHNVQWDNHIVETA